MRQAIQVHDFSAHSDLKDEDVLVLPMDMVALNKHQTLTEEVLKHFGRVKMRPSVFSPACQVKRKASSDEKKPLPVFRLMSW